MGGRYSRPLDGKQRRYLRGKEWLLLNFMPYYQRQLAATVLQEISRELDTQSKPTLQLLQSQAWGKGCEPRESTTLTGYLLVTTRREYTTLVSNLCQGVVGDYSHEDRDALSDPPTEFLLFLYHPLRKHLCLCTDSVESQHTWKSALQDGIRYCSTVLQRRDTVEVEAFLEAVRFYRQGKGSYKVGDLLLGTEPEILSNVLVEDLLPVLQSQVLPNLKGSENRRRQTWCQFLEEVYMLVLSQISSEFLDFQKEKEKLHIQLEKKIRPDLDQMLTLKDQISRKLQAVVQSPAESCCRQEVEPDLDCVMEELMHPISQGFDMVRSRFVDRVDEMITVVQSSSTSALQKELMQNSIHTFQQLSEQHLSMANNRNQITQVLEKVKGRVLKKFDYDSSSMRKQFAQEWLLQIFLPFLLKSLEPQCKLVSLNLKEGERGPDLSCHLMALIQADCILFFRKSFPAQ
uniref:Niban apoptosis regulator 3 n=1 Tax=Crocodylus porosus TaxID=8502 RepID=A0A7M4F5X0_CROPO